VDFVGLNGDALVPLFAGFVFAMIASEVPFRWCRRQVDDRSRRIWAGGRIFFLSSFAIAMAHAICFIAWMLCSA
jgi:hypothetical protein